MYGHLLGDALGVPFEFMSPSAIPQDVPWTGGGRHAQPVGTFSDDGSLSLCQIASLLAVQRFDADDTARRFLRWWLDSYQTAGGGARFDIGRTTEHALTRIHSGVAPLDAGGSSEFDNGNGSLMRILPVGLWHLGSSAAETIESCFAASMLTHRHLRAMLVCALHGLTLQKFYRDKPQSMADAEGAAANELRAFFSGNGPMVLDSELALAELDGIASYTTRTGGIYVVDSFRSALDAVSTTSSYVNAVKKAVRYGHDTDTTAAIAGGLAGFQYGFGALPMDWLRTLRVTSDQRAMIEAFVEVVADRVDA